MRPTALILLLVLAATAVPSAQAALTKPLPFEATYGYMGSLGSDSPLTITSGALVADAPRVNGSLGLFGVDAFRITGLTKACWLNGVTSTCRTGNLAIEVGPRASVGLCFPGIVRARVEADHALALFVDLAADNDLNTLPVDRSLVGPLIGGELRLSSIPPIADATLSSDPCPTSGAIVALDANTTLALRNGSATEKEYVGKQGRFVFAGNPVVDDLAPDLVVVPFGAGAKATFTPASRAAADQGLDGERIDDLIALLDQSHAGSDTTREGSISDTIDQVPDAVKRLLNGALVKVPTVPEGQDLDPAELTFARLRRLEVTSNGNALTWEGKATLAAQDGHITHAHKVFGLAWFALPWWGFLLWGAALTVWIVRLILHPEKANARWDRLKWIGWVATPLAVLLVFFLVDLEVRALFGSSFLSGTSGRTQLVFLGLDLVFTGLLGFMAGAPLRILLRNSFLLLRQGTFMGLAGSISALLGFLFGVWYFRDYLDLAFRQVIGQLA